MASVLKPVLFGVLVFLGGCRSYTQNTPREYFEGDNAANYQRVFGEFVPPDVTVVNSVVVGHAWRPGVVTTDDFAFELIAPLHRRGHMTNGRDLTTSDRDLIRSDAFV